MNKGKCPSCGAEPLQLKAPGVRYDHTPNCEIGRVILNQSKGGTYKCSKCPTTFTLKPFDFNGDSHSKECPICWATIEANNKKD